MGLKGSLRDFGISEILQLISGQRRTGRLEVNSGQGQYQILISSGKIVLVEKKPELKGESLSDYLARANALPQNQIKFAGQKAKAELKPLEAVLVGLEFISALDLKTFVFVRNLDLIYQLFLLKEGEYEFEAEPVNYHPAYVVEIDTEQVLMEGFRIKDEWNSILREIGSLDNLFQKKAGEFGLTEKLEGDQVKVYQGVDGKRAIAEIASLARLTGFDTIKTLAELKRMGRIEASGITPGKMAGKKSALGLVSRIGFWVLILILPGLAANGVRIYVSESGKGAKAYYDQSWQEERVRQGLEIYRLEQGGYPGQVSELVKKGILDAADLKFSQNRRYYYQEGGYTFNGPKP